MKKISSSWLRIFCLRNVTTLLTLAASGSMHLYAQLSAGSIAPASIEISTGTSPGVLTSNIATGGSCSGSYSYQWQSSPNGSTWTNISGATSRNFSPGNLSSEIYYRMRVICSAETAYSAACRISIGANTTERSYIRVRNITKGGVTDTTTANGLTDPYVVKQSTQYMDGLGRPWQTVARQASPLQKDMVNFQDYDEHGREVTKYLPYVATGSDGSYKQDPLGAQSSFNAAQFSGNQFFYGQATYEASPLNRPLVNYAPGDSWVGAGRGTSTQYLVNAANDSVRIWNISITAGSAPTSTLTYGANLLYKNVATDEQGHQVIQYTDLEGHMILKKIQLWNTPATGHSGWLCTYYIYDDLGHLRFVIQPQGVEWLKSNSWSFTGTNGSLVASELCFRYEYDARDRMIIKKIPGAGEMWLVYDMKDRLVMTQDSIQRSQHKWLFTRYDNLDRIDSTGLITDPTNYNNLAYHLAQAAVSVNYPVVASYTNEVLTMRYYDDYSWSAGASSNISLSSASQAKLISTYNVAPDYAVAATAFGSTRGLATGSKTKVLGTTNTYLSILSYYDDHGRIVQTQSSNYTGGLDTLTTQYSFSGQPLRMLLNHQKAGNTVQHHDILSKMSYDAGARLKAVWKNIDGAASDQLIDTVQYDELGQLKAKYLGNAVDSLVYDYNIRGWLTGINKNYVSGSATHYFGMELAYDKNSAAAPGTTYQNPQYNGNIAGTIWKGGGDGINRKYDFSYDNINRLTAAAFTQNSTSASWDSSTINFSVSHLTYDANGNILSMNQAGIKGLSSTLIDQLTYSYTSNSNKLSQVVDAANDSLSILGDFHYKGSKQPTDYGYDGNGSLTHDNNKAIDTIIYNYLNLPQQVHMKGKGNIIYTYDAVGNKLQKQTMDSLSRHATTALYVAGLVYQQTDTITNPIGGIDTLQFLLHEEGRTRWAFHRWTNGTTGYKWEYDFFEKDHLGNAREVLTQQRDTAQYLATMEAAYRTTENALFYNISNTNVWSYYVNGATNPFGTAVTNPNDSVCRISGSTPKEGPAIILKVMAGDQFKVGVNGYWKSGQTSTGTTDALTEILSSLANGIIATSGTGKGSYSVLSNTTSSPLIAGVNAFRSANNPTPHTNAKAYLNYITLDDQFKYDSAASGALALGGPDNLVTLASGVITVRKTGYLYIYLSNETKSVSVFFDNLSVTHYPGPLLEETHYYPFGLTMAGISDKALKGSYGENKYRYNGKELQNKEFIDGSGLEEYDYGKRMYNSQIGRWMTEDPLSDNFNGETPYCYAGNDPVNKYDVGGKFKFPVKDEARIKRDYPLFYKYIKSGIQDLLKSDRVVEAFMKYGHMNRTTLMNEFKFGSGAEIIVKDLGGFHKGRTQREKAEHNIELDERFLKLLQKAKPDDKDAALLVAMFTLLHEEAHRGNLADHMDNPNRTTSEDGYSLVDEIYGPLAENGFINSTFQDKDWEQNLIIGARMVIDDKKSRNQSEDLPTGNWDSAIKWVGNLLVTNPNIKLTVIVN